jgi:regulator of sigma E protease
MNTVLGLAGKYLIGLVGIGFVVIIHELGHLLVARLCGISVEIFSFGLGPKVWGFCRHSTEYRISLLPFGGFCRMKGADDLTRALDSDSDTFGQTEVGSLFSVHPIKRFFTYAAGPATNILFAILLYALLAALPYTALSTKPVIATTNDYPSLFGNDASAAYQSGLHTGDLVLSLDGEEIRDWEELEQRLATADSGGHAFVVERDDSRFTVTVIPTVKEGQPKFGLSRYMEPIVGSVRPGSPEDEAGLLPSDRIVRCNGKNVEGDLDLLVALADGPDETELLVDRDGTSVSIRFFPDTDENGDGKWAFSLQADTRRVEASPFDLSVGANTAFEITRNTVRALAMIVTGKSSDVRQEFTGMVRAALMIGDITSFGLENNVRSGIRALIYLLGIVSISLAIGNTLPLPAFDGGQMLLGLYETFSGSRVKPRHYWYLQLFGFLAVIMIFAFMTFVDLHHLYLIRR